MKATGEACDPGEFLKRTGSLQRELHERAMHAREAGFGREIFVRGVLEISNFCRENCAYCGMRRDNRTLHRYRLALERLLEVLLEHRPQSVTDINLQAGEDPVAVREIAIPLIRELRRHTTLGISACFGTLSEREYRELRESGADFYVIKIETGDEDHYRQMQSPGTLPERLAAIRHLASTGWHVSSGLILGLPGQTDEHIVKTLALLKSLPLAGNSVSPFIPGDRTALAAETAASLDMTLNCLAMMRLNSPERIIPAVSAMKLVGEDGYARAIRAGANLATVNLTPGDERSDYLLYKSGRQIMTEESVLREIERAGCAPSRTGMSEFLNRKNAALEV